MKAEKILTSKGRTWFHIFSDVKVSSKEAAVEQEKLGYSVAKYGKPQDFQCEDLNKGGRGFVTIWNVPDIG